MSATVSILLMKKARQEDGVGWDRWNEKNTIPSISTQVQNCSYSEIFLDLNFSCYCSYLGRLGVQLGWFYHGNDSIIEVSVGFLLMQQARPILLCHLALYSNSISNHTTPPARLSSLFTQMHCNVVNGIEWPHFMHSHSWQWSLIHNVYSVEGLQLDKFFHETGERLESTKAK